MIFHQPGTWTSLSKCRISCFPSEEVPQGMLAGRMLKKIKHSGSWNYLSAWKIVGFYPTLSEQTGTEGKKLEVTPRAISSSPDRETKWTPKFRLKRGFRLEVPPTKMCASVKRFGLISRLPLLSPHTHIQPSHNKQSDRTICIPAPDWSLTRTNRRSTQHQGFILPCTCSPSDIMNM